LLGKNRPKLDKSSANTLKANDFETVNNLESCADLGFLGKGLDKRFQAENVLFRFKICSECPKLLKQRFLSFFMEKFVLFGNDEVSLLYCLLL
jgi:hypothetical protein